MLLDIQIVKERSVHWALFYFSKSSTSSYAGGGYFVGVLPVRCFFWVHYVPYGYIVKYKKTCRSRLSYASEGLINYLLGFPEKITVPIIEQLPLILMYGSGQFVFRAFK